MSRRYFEECLSELENSISHQDLLRSWHSFDFDKLTWNERSELEHKFCEIRDEIRGYSNKLDTDFELADFCHGGDLTDDD